MNSTLDACFPRYTDFDPRVPVYCVTPDHPGTIHRFYDTSPFSPSGRYLALTRFPVERRSPRPGEVAEIIVIDLQTGETKVIAETRGWDVQLGAQVQWGADDHSLFFNDVETKTWSPFGLKIDPFTGKQARLDGTVYMISPDGQWSVSPCLLRSEITQSGYGVVVPRRQIPINRGASASDGIYLTNTESGQSRLFLSFAQIVSAARGSFPDGQYKNGDFYGFHVKWNPQGTRLLFVLRWMTRSWLPTRLRHSRREGGRRNVVTVNADGTDVRVAVADTLWSNGGNHPNWCPDGDHVIMNLNMDGQGLRFVKAKYDGTSFEVLAPNVRGSGHPTLHPNGSHILTDVYLKEPEAFGDGTAPIRWVDLRTCEETALIRIGIRPHGRRTGGALRVDPHPAWDRSFQRIAFNACPDGRRKVYVADLQELVARDSALRRAA